MKNKKLFLIILSLVLITALALPTLALSDRSVTENTDFIKEQTAVIGRPGYALTVRGDGSFYLGNEDNSLAVTFGTKAQTAEVTYEDSYYPITTHRYSVDGLSYTVSQFVYGPDGENICVYSRMTLKNETDKAVEFPKVTGAFAISGLPKQIEPGKNATVDFQTVVAFTDTAPTDSTIGSSLSYDDAVLSMKSFWDSYLSKKLVVNSVTKSNAEAYDNIKKALIYDSIGIHEYTASLALADFDLAKTVLSSTDDLYSAAVALSKTKETIIAVYSLPTFSEFADKIALSDGRLPHPTLEENLDALLSLQSYAYILRCIAKSDDSYTDDADNATAASREFAKAVAKALSDTEAKLSCDWEAATTDKTYSLILNGKDFASATALCAWYTKSSVFSGGASKELVALAKDACEFCPSVTDPDAAILSLFSEREDGTLILGRGAPYSLLSENPSIVLDNFMLSDGTKAGLKITVDKKTVTFNLSGTGSHPVQIEFPVFEGSIEYASTGFDSASGVVTVPEGTTTVTVHLSNSVSSLEKDRAVYAGLEAAIAEAYEKKVENPTSVSKDIFTTALKKAEKARTSTRDEIIECTEKLTDSTASLSPMVAGYTFVSCESNEYAGTISKDEVYQKFTPAETGTVTSVLVEGEYADGISCAVYTLRGDLYTIDELCAETYGTEAEGGILFDCEFNAVGGKTYVICLFSEEGDVTLSLKKTDKETAYATELGETIVFSAASLVFEVNVRQADRAPLDTFYSACLESDVSEYTKESQKALQKRMNEAKAHLCKSSATEDEYNKIYDNLKKAYEGLDTYASEDKIEEPPIIGIVLIAIVLLLLVATLLSSLAARKKLNSDN